MIWILVAHRASARLFSTSGRPGNIQLVREFDYPEGRRQNREIDTDAKGRHYNMMGRGNAMHGNAPSHQMKHGFDPHLEAAEHIADIFANELSHILRQGRTQNAFDDVMLVAETGFMGKLRGALDKETARKVMATFNHNLAELPIHELIARLEDLIQERRKIA